MPKHIGIIMDGNGRWAKKRGLPRTAGHTKGAATFKKIALYCNKIGLKYLTVYAFSTENWKRPLTEVNAIMKLFKEYLESAINDFQKENIKIRFIGDTSVLSKEILSLIDKVNEISKTKDGMVLNIAINYGGRLELVKAVKDISAMIESSKVNIEDIDENLIANNLYTRNQPDPDIIIRTGGEHRISNFLIWQSAYSEYFILDKMWPSFDKKDIDNVIEQYRNRNRRFGTI